MASLIPWKRRNEEKGGGRAGRTSARCARADAPGVGFAVRSVLQRLAELAGGDWPVTGWGFDVDDTGKEIVVHAEAPGFEPDDFNVEIVGDNLVLKAERKEEDKGGNGYHFRQERLYRTVALPHGVEADKIDARYHNGVLEIRMPKGEEAKGKRITVKAT